MINSQKFEPMLRDCLWPLGLVGVLTLSKISCLQDGVVKPYEVALLWVRLKSDLKVGAAGGVKDSRWSLYLSRGRLLFIFRTGVKGVLDIGEEGDVRWSIFSSSCLSIVVNFTECSDWFASLGLTSTEDRSLSFGSGTGSWSFDSLSTLTLVALRDLKVKPDQVRFLIVSSFTSNLGAVVGMGSMRVSSAAFSEEVGEGGFISKLCENDLSSSFSALVVGFERVLKNRDRRSWSGLLLRLSNEEASAFFARVKAGRRSLEALVKRESEPGIIKCASWWVCSSCCCWKYSLSNATRTMIWLNSWLTSSETCS